ncbi:MULTISPECIES: hypothetical protein [Pseudomonas]|uniref:hypothetical protein n=1 Tax=Pseudomonas TaxID=286 RepID=UPI001F490ACB|nr:hypothetical protein [Pseudomonas sputi]
MNYAVKIKLMIFMAIALVFPFLVFEVFAVFKLDFAEPYSYALSVPLVIFSFFILQFAIGLSVVKGWASSGMPKNYVYLFFWVFSTALLFALPKAFGRGGV